MQISWGVLWSLASAEIYKLNQRITKMASSPPPSLPSWFHPKLSISSWSVTFNGFKNEMCDMFYRAHNVVFFFLARER